MALVYGLTGSIGMGKSAVASMFEKMNVPVFDADAQVHMLQGPGGKALPAIESRFPGTTGPTGLDRAKMAEIVLAHPHERKALEAIIHPMVAAERLKFLRHNRSRPLVILDIPLLFEMHGERKLDGVIVVSAPAWKQRKRVLARPGMTHKKFSRILKLQMPDPLKRQKADHIIETGTTFHRTRAQVRALIPCLIGKAGGY